MIRGRPPVAGDPADAKRDFSIPMESTNPFDQRERNASMVRIHGESGDERN
jgi:hypothetical protein